MMALLLWRHGSCYLGDVSLFSGIGHYMSHTLKIAADKTTGKVYVPFRDLDYMPRVYTLCGGYTAWKELVGDTEVSRLASSAYAYSSVDLLVGHATGKPFLAFLDFQQLFLYVYASHRLKETVPGPSQSGAHHPAELFVAGCGCFDLGNSVMQFEPIDNDGQSAVADPSYSTCANKAGVMEYPVDPAGGTIIDIGDDDSREIPVSFSFPSYGSFYDSVFVNSNGHMTFDGSGDPSVGNGYPASHFDYPCISALKGDLSKIQTSAGRRLAGPL